MMEIIKQFKGGSLSHTNLCSDGVRNWVRKSISITENREYGLVRWQSQLRKLQLLNAHLPNNTIPVISSGIDDGYYFFDIDFIENSDNLCDALAKGVPVKTIVDQVTEILRNLSSISYTGVRGSLEIYVNEEIKRPFQLALNSVHNDKLSLSATESRIFASTIESTLELIDSISRHVAFSSPHESLTHGNFTLENALWDYNENTVKLIDPYAETYCESILGDVSQLLQSTASGYEVVSQYRNEGYDDILKYPYELLPDYLLSFARLLRKNVEKEKWFDPLILEIMHASQFSRMLPFKLVNDPRSGALFLNHAAHLIKEIKC